MQTSGITLIALVVTIVVLIILATISINAVLGENGIIKRAESARQHQLNAEASDNAALDELGTYLGDSIAEQEGKVARIGTTYYNSLQEAFDAVPTDGTKTTVELLKSISENVLVKENQNIVLNMNGKTITNIEGTAVAGDWEQSTFEVYGDLEVNNGKIVAVYGNGIENYGNVVINGGNVTGGDWGSVISNYETGTIEINGGTITSDYDITDVISNEGGIININGGILIDNGWSHYNGVIYSSRWYGKYYWRNNKTYK